MADGEPDEITQQLADDLRKYLDRPDDDKHAAFWETSEHLPTPPRLPYRSWVPGPRQFQLGRNLQIFRDTVVRLRARRRQTWHLFQERFSALQPGESWSFVVRRSYLGSAAGRLDGPSRT